MGLTVRGLLPFVRQYRPDVLESQCIFPIEETVRRICNYAYLAEESETVPVMAGSFLTPIVSTSGNEPNRVVRVMVPDIPSTEEFPATFLGYWDASTSEPGSNVTVYGVTISNLG